MKAFRWFWGAVLVALICLTPSSIGAQEAFVIDSFDTSIKIKANSTFDVTETITTDFSADRHGIYREIPTSYRDQYGNNRSIKIKKVSVTDESGRDREFEKSGFGELVLKIGDPDKLISGRQIYVIHYTVERGLNFFTDHDELYWNVTGTGWATPIYSASATVELPKTPSLPQLISFEGPANSSEKADSTDSGNTFNFQTNRTLEAYEGLTVVSGWDKGIVNEPSLITRSIWFLEDNWGLLLPILILVWIVRIFWTKGRDPQGRGTIVPEFAPPKDLSLVQLAALRDERLQDRDLTGLIISWAVDGFINIREPNKGKFELVKKKELTSRPKEEIQLFNKLFGTKKEVKLASLKDGKLLTTANQLKNSTFDSLVSKKYFVGNPQSVRNRYLGLGAVLLIALPAIALVSENLIGLGLGVITGLVVLILAPFMPRRTQEGVLLKEKILGFELYLKTAERYRLRFAEDKRLFERYLPHAIVLGVTTQWAKAFKGILKEPPTWYSGVQSQAFVSTDFGRSLTSSFNSGIHSTVTSASSGGSGFSGGGVGGGFGGGGGGSW